MSERVQVMGVGVDALTQDETLDKIALIIEHGDRPHQHVVVNAAKIVAANRDPELRSVIDDCDIVNADGMSVVLASRMLGNPLPQRVTGIDLMDELVRRASHTGWRIYFLGARQRVLGVMVSHYMATYPSLNVAGFRDGYWAPQSGPDVAQEIEAAQPDILFVALPSPQKENFLARHRDTMHVPFSMGVGGSFDVVAGETGRAPVWMQRTGMEWIFRFVQEPRRMWRRYIFGNAQFGFLLARYILMRWASILSTNGQHEGP